MRRAGTRSKGAALERFLLCWILLGALSIVAGADASVALTASPADRLAGIVDSTAPSLPSPPSAPLPSAPVPATPPPPSPPAVPEPVAPAPPATPSLPQGRRQAPTGQPPARSAPSGSHGDATSAGAGRDADAARSASNLADDFPTAPGDGGEQPKGSAGVAAASIAAAGRWLAYVWPGIPVSAGGGLTSAVGSIVAGLLRPAALGVARLLAFSPSLAAVGGGDPVLAANPAPAGGPAADGPKVPALLDVPAEWPWKTALFLVVMVLLLVLLTVTFRRELGPSARVRPRR